MPEIYLVRHDRSDYSRRPKSDFFVPLVAEDRGRRLGKIGVNFFNDLRQNGLEHSRVIIFYSPLLRTLETARGIGRQLARNHVSHRMIADDRLRDIDRGPWSNWSDAQREARDAKGYQEWREARGSSVNGWLNTPYPLSSKGNRPGQSPKDIITASEAMLRDVEKQFLQDKKPPVIVIVGHGLNLKCLGEILLRGDKDLMAMATAIRNRGFLTHGGIWHIGGPEWKKLQDKGTVEPLQDISPQSRSRE